MQCKHTYVAREVPSTVLNYWSMSWIESRGLKVAHDVKTLHVLVQSIDKGGPKSKNLEAGRAANG